MQWYLKTFNELSVNELFKIYYYRMATFVVAQKRIYQGVDRTDLKAHHLFALDKQGRIVAYARFFPNGKTISFGRVLVTPHYRHRGFGTVLMKRLLKAIREVYGNRTVTLYSQYDKRNFYKKFNLKTVGKPFFYMHTKHIKMSN